MPKLSASLINRTRYTGKKLIDGNQLYFRRSKDLSLTAFQRIKVDGVYKDIKVGEAILGEINQVQLQDFRIKAFNLRQHGVSAKGEIITFADAWNDFFTKATSGENPKWGKASASQAQSTTLKHLSQTKLWLKPLVDITSKDLELSMLDLKKSYPKSYPKVLLRLRQVFDYLKHDGLVETNPATSLQSKIKSSEKLVKTDFYKALTDFKSLRALLSTIKSSELPAKNALILQAYTVQRSGEVVGAKWSEFDFDNNTWTIPRSRMKIRDREGDQVLILPVELIALINTWQNDSEYLFPLLRNKNKHLLGGQLSVSLVKLGYKDIHLPHSWRSALKTLATQQIEDDRPKFADRWAEDLLDHLPKLDIEKHYLRKKNLDGMKLVLSWWYGELNNG